MLWCQNWLDSFRVGLWINCAKLLVLLYLSAAFSIIDHGILAENPFHWILVLLDGSLTGSALSFSGRSQRVVLRDCCCSPWPLAYGVPQGSLLSAMLFSIYLKSLGEVMRRFGLWCHQYADDHQLYFSIPSNLKEALETLNLVLKKVMDWIKANKQRLNPDKTEVLLIGSSSLLRSSCTLLLDGSAFSPTASVRSLGMLLDLGMLQNEKVLAVASSDYQLRLVQ